MTNNNSHPLSASPPDLNLPTDSSGVSETASIGAALAEGSRAAKITLRSYAVLHWRGKLPLVVSYWINCLLLVPLTFKAAAFAINAVAPLHPQGGKVALVFTLLPLAGVWLWANVGAWRAATAYDDSSSWPWGALAKLGLMIGGVSAAYGLKA